MADDKADPKGGPGPLEPSAPAPPSLPEEIAPASQSPFPADLPDTALTIQKISAEPTDNSPTMISRRREAPDEAITSLRGGKLAHFDLEEPIGVGGMGAVIRSRDTQLDRIVALKVLPPHLATDPENVRRFQREARAAAKLDHENIARVFFFGEDQGLHFIAFEYVEGDNLRTVIDRKGRVPVPEAIHYLLQVATGLAHASARGVVHRDIKPSNIIITPTGRAKLVDMGLARSLEPHTEQLTQSGVTLGTFDYVSPEQALEPGQADVRSDIYSLGCTFYHMLTGQPPVPEGTVAKKLHFHEHGLPIDPRQLNPEIPDEVAAVLARMMAKSPKDRYQRCEHLVHHLLQIAQKLGGQVAVPEGVLFVDVPMPNPPRNRPVLVGGLAAGVVVGLVLFLGSLGGPSGQGDGQFRPWPSNPGNSQVNHNDKSVPPTNTAITQKGITQTPNPGAKIVSVHNVKEFTEALKAPVARISLAADRFDLKREDFAGEVPGLVFQGEELVIQPEDGTRRPVIRLDYFPFGKEQLWAALSVHSGKVTIRGVRFVINPHATETAMTAVLLREGALTLENCEFVQEGLAEEPELRHVSSVQAGVPGGLARPVLYVDRCFFPGGDQAILLNGSATVDLVNCAFGPHSSLCHARATKVQQDTEASLRSCSAFLPARSAAFLLAGGASCNLKVDNCLFAATAEPATPADGAVLIRQTGDRAGDLSFVSRQRNVYANLAAFWARESSRGVKPPLAATLEDFKIAGGVTVSPTSVALTTSPWQNKNALDLLATRPELAFTVNGEWADLRQADVKKAVGVQRCTWGDLYFADLGPSKERRPDLLARRFKTVNPKLEQSDGKGVYPTLGQALGEAQPEDVILIQHNGEVRVDALRLNKVRGQLIDVTIRPDQGFKPVLVLGDTSDKDAALFRLHDGSVTFEDLEIRLVPEGPFESISVVQVVGEGQCVFKRCVLTLEETKQVPASLVTLADLATVMSMDPPSEKIARLRFEECFVRGNGDLVTVKASRQFQLDLKECLIALDGTLLVVDPSAKEMPGRVYVSFDRVTAYLAEHLFLLRANKEDLRPATGLVPIQVTRAHHSLFAAKGSKSLVHVRGVDTEPQIKSLFTWMDGKDNVYSSYSVMLDQQPRGEGMPLEPLDQGKWEVFAHETAKFTKVKFAAWPPAVERPLGKAQPGDFAVKEPAALVDVVGAGIGKLPRPAAEPEPTPSSNNSD